MSPPLAKDADILVQQGLAEGAPNVHPGQGTANRRFFFQKSMLEFLYVVDEAETSHPRTNRNRLWERAHWQKGDWAPIGICIETEAGEALPFDTWPYYPLYLPEGASIQVADNDAFPSEPMIFCLPANMPARKTRPLRNPQVIQALRLTMPGKGPLSPALRALLTQGILTVEQGKHWDMHIELREVSSAWSHTFQPDIPLSISAK